MLGLQNAILIAIAQSIGVAGDLTYKSRNELLGAIASHYGLTVTSDSQCGYLCAIDEHINTNAPMRSRNGHIKSIAEGLGATGLHGSMSRNELMAAWLLAVVP